VASIRVGVTAAITGGGPTQALSAGTATPKLSLLELTSGLTAGTIADHYRWAFGVADGTTQRAMSGTAEDGNSASLADGEGRYDTATCINLCLAANNNLDGEATHSSFGAGSHTISWADFPAAANLIKHVFFGGADVSVAIREVTGSATIGNSVDVTDCGFDPNLAIVFGRGNAAFSADGTWNPFSLTLGYAVKTAAGAAEQFSFSDLNGDRVSPTDGRSMFRNDRCAQRLTIAADQGALELSWLTGGARFTTRDVADACSVVVAFVLVPSRRLRAMNPALVTSSTGNKSITGVGFQSFGYFAIGTDLSSANTSSNGADRSKWSHGIVDDAATAVACTAMQAEDAATTSDTRSGISTTQFARVVDDAGGDSWSASHVSFDSDGVTINIDDASSADRMVGFVFWSADEATSVQSETVQISDGLVTLHNKTAVVGETVEISDALATLHNLTAVLGETVEISDALATLQNLTAVVGETVEISDALATLQGLTAVLGETVEISETEVFLQSDVLVADETVEISDGAVFVTGSNDLVAVFGETVEISEGVILIHSALLAAETVELLEQVNFTGTGVGATVNETVEISDAVVAYLGEIRTLAETVEISDAATFGAGLVPGKASGGRGETVQGGARDGETVQGGAKAGGTYG